MAMVMSFSDSLYPIATGVGIVVGGTIAELAGPRVALASAGCGGLVMTAVVWVVLGAGTAHRGSRLEPVKADAMEPVRQ